MNTLKTIWLIFILATLEIPLSVGAVENDPKGHPITFQTTELSISFAEMDDATLMQYALRLRKNQPELFGGAQGVLILMIVQDSQAQKKGLQRGDIVIAYARQQINSTEQLVSVVQANATKAQVNLQFIRANVVQTIVLKAGYIGVRLTDIKEEMSLEQFENEFITALQAQDVDKIGQLFRDNPNTAKVLQQRLTNLGKITGKKAEQDHALAGLVGKWHQALSNISALVRLQEEGIQAYYIADYPTALEKWKLGLNLSRLAKNQQAIGVFLGNISNVYQVLGQYQKALIYYQQALTIDREIKNRRGEGANLANIGALYQNLGQYQTALDSSQQALTIHREIKDRHGEGTDLNNIGMVYNYLGQYQAALNSLQQALKIRHEINDRRGEGDNLTNIGIVYDNLAQYQTALDYYQQALTIHRETKNRYGEGANLGNIGNVYQNLGQYQTALDYYQQALAIHSKIKNRPSEGKVLGNITALYQKLGQYQTALDYYQQVLKIMREINDRRGEGMGLGNIGLVYLDLGQYQTALDFFLQALTIHREIRNKYDEGAELGNIGLVYQKLGQYQTALDYYQQALTIHREIKNGHGEWIALLNIGVVYDDLGKYQQAKESFQNSAVLSETIGSDGLWLAQRGLAFTEAKLNQYQLAIQHYQQALDNIEKLRAGITAKEHKFSFMRQRIYIYDELIALLQSLHPNHPNKNYDRKALDIFERKQGSVFLEEIGESGARRFAGVSEQISQRDKEFEQHIATIRKSRTEALAQGKDAELHHKRLEKLEAEQADFEKTLKTDYPAYYALKYPKPVALETLQKDVLQTDELMLIYNVRKEATDLWVVGKKYFALFTLPLTAAQMQQEVSTFRNVGIESMLSEIDTANDRKLKDAALMRHLAGAVEENLPDFVETSDALYQQLLPEAARKLIAKAKPSTLYIVPTGALYSLPFESLVTEPDEDEPRYLLQDYAIAYLSSASLLKTLRDAQDRREIKEREPLLAFADPVYPQDKSCQELNQGIKGLRTRAYQKFLGGEGVCFPALPETADEVKAIAKLFNVNPDSQPKPLHLQEEASVETVELFNEYDELDDFQYVLFSTHAILPNEISYIEQPALVLSYPEQNGYLKMADVFGLKMNADLVMLSACNTGRGNTIKGEGVRGLTRAFMYAGTPAVAVTLWSVESLASQQLGIHLFTQLKMKQPLAEGLRQAKLAMLKDDKSYSRHPYFWAGFVVFGDGL